MARPTKLTDELVAKAAEYDYVKLKQAVPTVEGLALFTGVHRDTVNEWSKVPTPKTADEPNAAEFNARIHLHVQFSVIVSDLLATQALELVNNGLRGRFNAKIANMMLSKHGYVETQHKELNHTGAVQFVNDVPRPAGDGPSTNA